MVRASDGSWDLSLALSSPTTDARRTATVWLDEKHVPSIGFGGWHSQADLWGGEGPDAGVDPMLEFLMQILRDEITLIARDGEDSALPHEVLHAGDREALLDELTAPGAPDRISLLSWSGSADRVVGLGDLKTES